MVPVMPPVVLVVEGAEGVGMAEPEVVVQLKNNDSLTADSAALPSRSRPKTALGSWMTLAWAPMDSARQMLAVRKEGILVNHTRKGVSDEAEHGSHEDEAHLCRELLLRTGRLVRIGQRLVGDGLHV